MTIALLEARTIRIARATQEAREALNTFQHFDAYGLDVAKPKDAADFNRAAMRLAGAIVELGEVIQLANADAIAKWWTE